MQVFRRPIPANIPTFSTYFACGFECGILSEYKAGPPAHYTGGHFQATNGASPGVSIVSTPTRGSSQRSLKVDLAAQACALLAAGNSPTSKNIGRLYIYFDVLPDADTILFGVNTIGAGYMGVGFKVSDSKLYCAQDGGAIAFGASGVTVTTGVWYRIDFKFSQQPGALSSDAMVNGVALGGLTNGTFGTAKHLTLGSTAAVTTTYYVDDVILSREVLDYPLGPGHVYAYLPASDAVHNTGTAGNFKRGAAGSNITNADTDIYTLINKFPLPPSVVTDSFINATQIAASNYVEFGIAKQSGYPNPTKPPRHLAIITAYHLEGFGAYFGNIVKLIDGSNSSSIANGGQFSGSGSEMWYHALGADFNLNLDGGPWRLSGGAGNFNNVKFQWGFSTENYDAYLDGLIIEAEFPE